MMDFMDSLKRGVDRAGFEVDRLLRANRVRARINALRAQADDEMRQIGRQVVELCDRGEMVREELRDHCERVKQYEAEIAEREGELEAINREAPPIEEQQAPETVQTVDSRCPACDSVLPEDAAFCHRCGTEVRVGSQRPAPPEQP